MRGNDFNVALRGTLFEAKHYERMSSAVWLYGWLVLRQTRQDGTTGCVLGGKPISYREIWLRAEDARALDARPARRRLHRDADGSGRRDCANHEGEKVLARACSTQFCGGGPQNCGCGYAELRRH